MRSFTNVLHIILLGNVYLLLPALCKVDESEIPSALVSVSKFIKEFHKKLEDDSYPRIKSETNDRDFPTLIDNISFYTMKGEMSDKNVSSLVKCNNKSVGTMSVELVNTTRLSALLVPDPNVTSRLIEGPCLAILFFSPSCPFSCLAAPHFNSLPRAFPTIKMAAINAIEHQTFNTQFGIAGVPAFMLFHNGKAAAKFNDSDNTLEMFAKFVTRITALTLVGYDSAMESNGRDGLLPRDVLEGFRHGEMVNDHYIRSPSQLPSSGFKFDEHRNELRVIIRTKNSAGIKAEDKMFVSSSDFGGPVPTVLVKETDYVLGLAWAVIILTLIVCLTRLERWHAFIESIAAVWREANHEHTD